MEKFMVGDKVQLVPEATFTNGKKISNNLFGSKLYIREVKNNTSIIAKAKTGAVLGEIANDNLKLVIEENAAAIKAYIVSVEQDVPLYKAPSENSMIIRNIKRFNLITIVDEKDGFGKIKKGAGWLKLADVKKI